MPVPPAHPGRRGGGGTGRYQRGAPRQLRHVPAISRVPPRPPAPGQPGIAPGAPGGHRGGHGATSCPRARRRHKGGSVRPGPARTKGALRGGAARIWGVRSCGRSPRCPRAPRSVPEPLNVPSVPAGSGPRGWHPRRRRWHMEQGTRRGVPRTPGHPGSFGVTPAPPARPALGVFPLGIQKQLPGGRGPSGVRGERRGQGRGRLRGSPLEGSPPTPSGVPPGSQRNRRGPVLQPKISPGSCGAAGAERGRGTERGIELGTGQRPPERGSDPREGTPSPGPTPRMGHRAPEWGTEPGTDSRERTPSAGPSPERGTEPGSDSRRTPPKPGPSHGTGTEPGTDPGKSHRTRDEPREGSPSPGAAGAAIPAGFQCRSRCSQSRGDPPGAAPGDPGTPP